MANINYYLEGGYWDISSKLKPLLHLWSLGVEEQFYMIWPILLWLFICKKFRLIPLFAILILTSMGWNLFITKIDQPMAFFLPFSRFWEFLTGGFLAYSHFKFEAIIKCKLFHRNICSCLGVVLIIVGLFANYSPTHFPGLYALLPTLGSVLIIFGGSDAWVNSKIFSEKIVVYIGLISYPIYLWHWPLLSFNTIISNGTASIESRVAIVLLTILLSIVTYHFFEKPIRKNSVHMGIKALILAIIIFLCGLAGYLIYVNKGFEGRLAESQKIAPKEYSTPPHEQKSVQPSPSTDGKTFVIMGDSQASMFASGIHLPPEEFKVFSTAGWPYLIGTSFKKISNKNPSLTIEALQHIASDPKIDIVVLANMYNLYTDYDQYNPDDKFFSTHQNENENSKSAYFRGLRTTAKTLSESGKKILYIKSIPFLGGIQSTEACNSSSLPSQRSTPRECLTPRHEIEQLRAGYDQSVKDAFNGISNITIFDPTPYLCDQNFCYVSKNGILIYRDMSHLTVEGASIMAPKILDATNRMRH